MNAGCPDRDGLVIISWDGREECLPYIAHGSWRKFIVPSGVTQINVQVWGAVVEVVDIKTQRWGYSEGKLDVQPGDLYIVGVGQTARGHRPRYSPGGAGSGN